MSSSSLPKTRISSHESGRSIFFWKEGWKFILFRFWLVKVFQIFLLNITGLNIKSDKGKATSSHSSKPSKKKASALSKSSYFTTGSSNALYLSVSERRKSAEHAKLAARQAEERTQRQLSYWSNRLSLKGKKLRKKY